MFGEESEGSLGWSSAGVYIFLAHRSAVLRSSSPSSQMRRGHLRADRKGLRQLALRTLWIRRSVAQFSVND